MKFLFIFIYISQLHCTFAQKNKEECILHVSNINFINVTQYDEFLKLGNGNYEYPYPSLTTAFLNFEKTCANSSNVKFILFSDFNTLSSYEIDYVFLKYPDYPSIRSKSNNYKLFQNYSNYLHKIKISYGACEEDPLCEKKSEIAILDQKISFFLDFDLELSNLNFTGTNINLNYNETLHKTCIFSKLGCCQTFSCLIFMGSSTTSNNQSSMFIIGNESHPDLLNVKIESCAFHNFLSYPYLKSVSYNSLFSINTSAILIVNDVLFSKGYFPKGLIISYNDTNIILKFKVFKIQNYNPINSLSNSSSDSIVFNIAKNASILFENMDCQNLTIRSFFKTTRSKIKMKNITLTSSFFERFLDIDENTKLMLSNSTVSNINCICFLMVSRNSQIKILNFKIKKATINETLFNCSVSNKFILISSIISNVLCTKSIAAFNLSNLVIFYKNTFEFIVSSSTPSLSIGIFHFNYSNSFESIKCLFSNRNASSSWLTAYFNNTLILKDGIFENSSCLSSINMISNLINKNNSFYLDVVKFINLKMFSSLISYALFGLFLSNQQIIRNCQFLNIYSKKVCILSGTMSILLVYKSFFINFLSDSDGDYFIFFYRNSLFKIKDCIFRDFDRFRSYKSRYYILFSETSDIAYFESLTIENSTLNLMYAPQKNRVMFQNFKFSFDLDILLDNSIFGLTNNFLFFKNCSLHLQEKINFQIMKRSIFILKNSELIQYFGNPSMYIWNDVTNSMIVLKNSVVDSHNAFFFLTEDNKIHIKNCRFTFRAEKNIKQIIKAFYSNKILIENLKISGNFAQSNVDLLLFQIKNLIKIQNLLIFSLDIKENLLSGSMSRVIYMNFENSIFLTKNQTIKAQNILCFLEDKKKNKILIREALFSGELLFAELFLKLQDSLIIIELATINKFKCLFLNLLEGRFILKSVFFFSEGKQMLANLANVSCSIFKLKIDSKNKIIQPFLKFNQSEVFFSKLVITGIHIKEGFLISSDDSNVYIKEMLALNIKGYSESSGLLRISGMNRHAYLKRCNFFMNFGSGISPLFLLDFSQFSSLYILYCKLSFNSAPKGNIIHFSHSKGYNFFLYKNTLYSNAFKKNNLPIISKGGLFFSYFSEGILINVKNRLQKNKADFGKFIYIQEEKTWNFVDEDDFNVLNTKEIKEKEFSIAFFDSYSENLRALKLEGIIFDKKYENCLLKIKITSSSYGDILDPYLSFTDAFDLTSSFEYNRQIFLANFYNVEGYYCLKGEFRKSISTSFFSSSRNFKIIFKKSQIGQAIFLTMSFIVQCDPPKFLDYSGVCSSCPIQTYPSAFIKTLSFSKDSPKRCLTCDLANKIGLFCFGDDIYTPRINYWQPKYGHFLYFRCPFEGNCRGDILKESNEMNRDEKYSTRFCEKNFKGLLCLSCKEGFGRWLENTCESCYSEKNIFFLICQITIKMLVCVYILSISLKINCLSSLNMNLSEKLYLKKLQTFYVTYTAVNMHIQMIDSILSLKYEAFPYFNTFLDVLMIFSTQLKFFIPFQCWSFLENNVFFAKLTIYIVFYAIILIIFLITIFKLSIFSKYVRSSYDKIKYISSALFISFYAVYFLFSSTIIELVIKIFFCVEMKIGDNSKILSLFLFDTNFDCNTKDFAIIYKLGIFILLILLIAPCSILIIKLISKKNLFVEYIFCHYKPKYILTGIHYHFPQLILIALINYIQYTKIINGDIFFFFSLLGIWILFFLFRKAIISVYVLSEIRLKNLEILLWTYLFVLLIMVFLKINFAYYNYLFVLDFINLIIVVLLIFVFNEPLIHNLKLIFKNSLSYLYRHYFKRNLKMKFRGKRRKKKKNLFEKNKFTNRFKLNHDSFLHKYISKNYLKSIGSKEKKSKKTNSRKILKIIRYFFKFKGRFHLQNEQLILLFKFAENNFKQQINFQKKLNIFNIESLFDCKVKISVKIKKKILFANPYLLFSFKNLTNLNICDFFVLVLTESAEKQEKAEIAKFYQGHDMDHSEFKMKQKNKNFSFILLVRYKCIEKYEKEKDLIARGKKSEIYEAIFFVSIRDEKKEIIE